jgi:RimJ/RimL family protein N-acetyltransferase
VWLGIFPANLRARRAYEAVAFQVEGVEYAPLGGERLRCKIKQ